MKRWISFALAFCLALGVTGCGGQDTPGASQEAGASYTYEYQGMAGPETAQLDLGEDGSCRFCLPGHPVITDVYVGTYTREGNEVTLSGLTNQDPNAQHPAPGLWPWIVDGGAVVTVDDGTGTFVPAEGESAGQAENSETVTAAYADGSPSQVCDIYPAEGEGQAPVIVLIHGGGFMFGDAKMPLIQPVIQAALARGYAVVSVDYRKSGEAVFPAAVADVKAAVRFVKANAAEYGFDSERIAVWGESAGAYLALMTALTPDVPELNGDVSANADVSSAVKALVSFYAPVEFYTLYEEAGAPQMAAESFESKFLGSDITADKEATYTTYWETYAQQLPADVKAWIQAGDSDSKVPYTQSEHFAQRLAGYLGEESVTYSLLPGADHEDAQFYTEENLTAVLDWLDGVWEE